MKSLTISIVILHPHFAPFFATRHRRHFFALCSQPEEQLQRDCQRGESVTPKLILKLIETVHREEKEDIYGKRSREAEKE